MSGWIQATMQQNAITVAIKKKFTTLFDLPIKKFYNRTVDYFLGCMGFQVFMAGFKN